MEEFSLPTKQGVSKLGHLLMFVDDLLVGSVQFLVILKNLKRVSPVSMRFSLIL